MTAPEFQPGERHPLAGIDTIVHAPARLMVLTYLYVVESADYVFLVNMTGLTWGNLSSHIAKLEEAGYLELVKTFRKKKPHTMVRLTTKGRDAFRTYRTRMLEVLQELPD